MKWLFIGFIVIQVGVDLAHSVTAFPFVHYGMFSESFARPDSLAVYEVTVDGKLLLARDFRVYRWDMIQGPLAASEEQHISRDFEFDKEKMDAGLARVGGKQFFHSVSPLLNNSPSVEEEFADWYKQYLSGLLGHPVRSLRVEKAWYRYAGGRLVLLRKETRINS
jgi:hypothetical protein